MRVTEPFDLVTPQRMKKNQIINLPPTTRTNEAGLSFVSKGYYLVSVHRFSLLMVVVGTVLDGGEFMVGNICLLFCTIIMMNGVEYMFSL